VKNLIETTIPLSAAVGVALASFEKLGTETASLGGNNSCRNYWQIEMKHKFPPQTIPISGRIDPGLLVINYRYWAIGIVTYRFGDE
jgi:hypothetical protein